MGTTGVIIRESTGAAERYQGGGRVDDGGEHGEGRMVKTARGKTWEGMRTAIATLVIIRWANRWIIAGQRIYGMEGWDMNTLHLD